MAQSLTTWIKKQCRIVKSKSIEELSAEYCFRDPLRPIRNNPEIIYAPADGIIVDICSVNSTAENIYGKYGNMTLKELTYYVLPEGSYTVVSIFLTFYDVHIVRTPVNGVIKKISLPPIYVENRPMLSFEDYLMDGKFTEARKELLKSFAYNQRTLLSIQNSFLREKMYLLLTADYDIDTILSFIDLPNHPMKQNQRIASIRYGSMVTCIVPTSWNLETICKEGTHVEAGNDSLFYYG